MTLPTKYSGQIARARAQIVRKGTVCTWVKSNNPAGATPEFPVADTPKSYPNTPIVFYPQKRQNLVTILLDKIADGPSDQLFALIPGDVPFTPAIGDIVTLRDNSKVTVAYLNVTQPDLVPIVYEIGFK